MGSAWILHLENSDDDAELIRRTLDRSDRKIELVRASTEEEFRNFLVLREFDLILADYHLPAWNGVEALATAKRLQPRVPFIFLSEVLGEEIAVELLKLGATDYVLKTRLGRLNPSIIRALGEAEACKRREVAESALRSSEAALRALADSMPQIVWSASSQGEVEYLNKRWEAVTAMPRGQSLSIRVWDKVVHPDDLERFQAGWHGGTNRGEPWELECRLLDARTGAYRWFLLKAMPSFGERGELVRWFGTATDIDDQKTLLAERERLLESERSARTEAERASRSKDEFLAILSHELRTPLNAILGWTQLMRRKYKGLLDAEEGLQVIDRNARIQVQLIEDLLDLSRVLSGKLSFDRIEVEVRTFVDAAINTVKHSAEAKNIIIERRYCEESAVVRGDVGRLQQVVWNLLSNAIKFSHPGGRILVEITRDEHNACVIVRDEGTGIPLEFLPFVFDRFRQAEGVTARRSGGLGVGLAVVKHLVEAHDGRVEVFSDGPDHGAMFTVILPASTGDASEVVDTHINGTTSLALDQLTILLVEDDRDSREFLKRILEDQEATVLAAESAAEGLELLHEGIGLIISDIGMPHMDGYTFIKTIRANPNPKIALIPAMALTAFARPEDRHAALQAGFQCHLAKPVDPSQIVSTASAVALRVSNSDVPDSKGRRRVQ